MESEREVAGIRCGQVLELLPDYVEGRGAPVRREQVEAHLRGCDRCARFGGAYAGVAAALRRALLTVDSLPEGVELRLRARLDGG